MAHWSRVYGMHRLIKSIQIPIMPIEVVEAADTPGVEKAASPLFLFKYNDKETTFSFRKKKNFFSIHSFIQFK
jgi:hypothetical protein